MNYYEQKKEWKRINFFRKLQRRAKRNMLNMNGAEQLIWEELRTKVNPNLPTNCYFQRQWVQVPYILDFYCQKKRICIEVDGFTHDQKYYDDRKRDAFLLNNFGIVTYRIENDAVYDKEDLSFFIEQILEVLKEK